MASTESTMVGLATQAPDFELPDVISGKTVNLASFADATGLLVMFLAPHCPYVKHIQQGLADLLREFEGKPLAAVAIGSNDAAQYPDDAPDGLRAMAQKLGWTFPYCYDESQAVAKAYQAACTPDFFLFDSTRKLVYRGQFDDSRPKNDNPITGADLRKAIEAVLSGDPVSEEQKPSIGCNIKWKSGNEPTYFLSVGQVQR